jgi:GDP-4-dehydro-6-deoxy-D-mannose reductase
VSDFARQVARIERQLQEPVLAVGNLEVTRDFLDVRDVVEAYQYLLEKGRSGEVYNVCSGREVVLNEVVKTLISFASRPIELRVDHSRFRPVDTPRMCGSHGKLTADTGWRPTRDTAKTLAEVFAYWKESREL